MTTESQRIEDLEQQLRQLQGTIEQLAASRGGSAAVTTTTTNALTEDDGSTSRRRFLTKAAIGVAGAGLLVAKGAEPAFAADPNDVTMGERKSNAGVTQVDYTGTQANSIAFLVQSGTAYNGGADAAQSQACVAGWATAAGGQLDGVYGFTEKASGRGVVGTVTSSNGIGILADAATGSSRGVVSNAAGNAVEATSTAAVGGKFTGPKAAVTLGASTWPPTGTNERGSLAVQSSGTDATVWVCVQGGSPGTWVRVAGPGTAGAFQTITPTRVYDSRLANPTPGKLSSGNNRLVSVKDGRSLSDGTVNAADIVPSGATAIAYNLTVVNTDTLSGGSGYLTVNPGGTTAVASSTINWFANNQILANSAIVGVNASRQVTVVCGAGSTDFIIDVVGYYL